MYIFNLQPTTKSIKWFKDNNFDLKAMGAALSLLFADVEQVTYTKQITLTLQVVEGAEESSYRFTTNKIHLCDDPDENAKSKRKKELAIFDHFLHEFRHWMQSKVYKLSHTKLSYTDDDVFHNTRAYFHNDLEVDARRFSKQYMKKFYRYYKAFKH
jgi:hypothetical protein